MKNIDDNPTRKPNHVRVYVDTQTAIEAGFATSGTVSVTLTDEWLQTLTEEERKLVAEAVAKRETLGKGRNYPVPEFKHWTDPHVGTKHLRCEDPPLVCADLDAVLAVVQHRLAHQGQIVRDQLAAKGQLYLDVRNAAAELVDEYYGITRNPVHGNLHFASTLKVDPRLESFIELLPKVALPESDDGTKNDTDLLRELCAYKHSATEEIARLQAEAKEQERHREAIKQAGVEREAEAEERRQKALDDAVARWGNANQQERHEGGYLPRDEALNLIRDYVWADAFRDIMRYQKLEPSDLEGAHNPDNPDEYDDCYVTASPPSTYSSDDLVQLTADQWDQIEVMRARCKQHTPLEQAQVLPRVHTAECDECGATVDRPSVLVRLVWHGWKLSREFMLPTEKGLWALDHKG